MTFLEMNKTVAANKSPWVSIIIGSSILKDWDLMICHSTKVVIETELTLRKRHSLVILRARRIFLDLRAESIIVVP